MNKTWKKPVDIYKWPHVNSVNIELQIRCSAGMMMSARVANRCHIKLMTNWITNENGNIELHAVLIGSRMNWDANMTIGYLGSAAHFMQPAQSLCLIENYLHRARARYNQRFLNWFQSSDSKRETDTHFTGKTRCRASILSDNCICSVKKIKLRCESKWHGIAPSLHIKTLNLTERKIKHRNKLSAFIHTVPFTWIASHRRKKQRAKTFQWIFTFASAFYNTRTNHDSENYKSHDKFSGMLSGIATEFGDNLVYLKWVHGNRSVRLFSSPNYQLNTSLYWIAIQSYSQLNFYCILNLDLHSSTHFLISKLFFALFQHNYHISLDFICKNTIWNTMNPRANHSCCSFARVFFLTVCAHLGLFFFIWLCCRQWNVCVVPLRTDGGVGDAWETADGILSVAKFNSGTFRNASNEFQLFHDFLRIWNSFEHWWRRV